MPFWRLYYHLVWATKGREALISEAAEACLYGVLVNKSTEKGTIVFAVNGMPDHVHLVAAIPPSIAISEFIQFIKGASSYVMQREYDLPFGWQRGRCVQLGRAKPSESGRLRQTAERASRRKHGHPIARAFPGAR